MNESKNTFDRQKLSKRTKKNRKRDVTNGDSKTETLKDDVKKSNITKRQKKVKIKFRHRHPWMFGVLTAGTVISMLTIGVGTAYVTSVIQDAPTVTEEMLKSDGTSNMYAADGTLIWSDTEIRRDYVKYDQLKDSMYTKFLVDTEDANYWTSKGVSLKGILNAVWTTIGSKIGLVSDARGGSTIEQQLIKNSTDIQQYGTVKRKIMEWWLSFQIDENFTKEQLLEYYVNKMELGESSYGADTVMMTYYGVHIYDLTDRTAENLSKLAVIAGLGQSPTTYNLYDHPDYATSRRNEVLLSALNRGDITEAEYNSAKAVDVTSGLKERYWRNNEINSKIARYNSYIMSTLDQIKSLGYDIDKTPMQIKTHLNLSDDDWLIEQAKQSSYYRTDEQQVAVTVVDPTNGYVIAQVGNRNDDTAYGINRASQRTRSSGSTIKPFIDYGPAIEYLGYSSASTFDTSAYTYPGTSIVSNNYGGYTYGVRDMKYSLRMSLNTPANRLLDTIVGSDRAKQFLSGLGLDVKDSYGGSDALGLDLSTVDFASAFAALANLGTYYSPQYVDTITFSDGSVRTITDSGTQAMKQSTAYILNKILEGTTQQGYSAQQAAISSFGGYIVKTGTVGYADDGTWRPNFSASDSWISGATKSVSVSLWTGYDSPNETDHWITADQTTKYDLFVDVMNHFNRGKDTSDWSQPSTVSSTGTSLMSDWYPLDTDTTAQSTNDVAPDVASSLSTNLFSIDTSSSKTSYKISATDDYKIPSGYKIGSWINELSDSDRTIYNLWDKSSTSATVNYSSDTYTGDGS